MSNDLEPSPCPVCSEPSYVFKEYKFLHLTVVFLLVVAYHSYRSQWYYSCPACMRRELWRWNKRSLLTANIVWPFMMGPTFVSRFISTLLPWSSVGVRPWWKQTIGFLALLGAAAATVTVMIAGLSFFLVFAGNQAEGFRQAALIAIPSFALCVVIAAIVDF
jgi:hypothetical protein